MNRSIFSQRRKVRKEKFAKNIKNFWLVGKAIAVVLLNLGFIGSINLIWFWTEDELGKMQV
ncbi:hypothetical protein IQ238_22230 [Pleurocapsales cyanobacterium LEGE 06147]|nr:hypothetical protein [Pleurocapsales cyanobacterium LEGE 06147]